MKSVGSAEKRIIRNLTVYLVEKYMTANDCSRDEALVSLMKTVTFEALMDPETELFLESRESLWHILCEELDGNNEALLAI